MDKLETRLVSFFSAVLPELSPERFRRSQPAVDFA